MASPDEIIRYPASASDEYIASRQKLLEAEFALRNQIEEVAKLRRALPPGGIMKPYKFTEGPTDINEANGPIKETTLADLVSDGRTLAIYHMMFAAKDESPCTMCGAFVDGLNGVGQHLAHRINFAIVARAPIGKLREYAARRGWTNLRFLSSSENDFNADMHMERPEGAPDAAQLPGLSVFKKDAEDPGKVRHTYTVSASFGNNTERGLDALSPLWNMFDLLPEGRDKKWYPADDYIKMAKE